MLQLNQLNTGGADGIQFLLFLGDRILQHGLPLFRSADLADKAGHDPLNLGADALIEFAGPGIAASVGGVVNALQSGRLGRGIGLLLPQLLDQRR